MRLLSLLFPVKIGEIKSFYLSGADGCEMYSGYHYRLTLSGSGGYEAEYKQSGKPDEKAYKKQADKAFADRLCRIMKDKRTGRYNGYRKTNRLVMDGTGFGLDVRFTNGKSIKASGYMKSPAGYNDFEAAVCSLFEKLFESEIEKNEQEDKHI